jgi:perosamine synthetase
MSRKSRIPWARPILFGNEIDLIRKAVESTFISGGAFIEEFESQFSQVHGGSVTTLTVNNGTSALQLAFLAINLSPGDEIIVPGWCFAAAANMVIACGGTPVFADIDEKTWLLCPEDVERKITNKTKAIVAVHSYGNVCDMASLCQIAAKCNIFLIEDCAESLFSHCSGKICGTFGSIACYSFQATKTITCGEGGAVMVPTGTLEDRMRLIRNHGMTSARKYWHVLVGHNFRLTNLQAAMLCAQLHHRDELIKMHTDLYERYRARLRTIDGIELQTFLPQVDPVVWSVAVRLPLYNSPRLPKSEAVAEETIALPSPPDLTEDEIDYVCSHFESNIRLVR